MHIILGAAGHVGSATAQALLEQGEPVTVVLHSSRQAAEWQQRGAKVAIGDVHDVDALRRIFCQGRRLFLLNPPADPATDAATEERKTVAAIVAALADSSLEKIVAESTYGAQPGDQLGDLGVLYELEQALAAQPIPASILRAAYYMSNWDAALPTARQTGQVPTFYPPDFKLPMVAPQDLGREAARLLRQPTLQTGLHCVEGPARYSPADVAAAFATALHRPVVAAETPRAQWTQALHKMGFSDQAAESFAAMTAVTLGAEFPPPTAVAHGPTTLQQYVQQLVAQPPQAGAE